MTTAPLEAKVALVTGASSGIGAATATLLAAQGAGVALVARRREQLEAVARVILAEGGDVAVFVADVSDEPQASGVTDEVLAHFGQIDVLVNSAGTIRPGGIVEGNGRDWRETLDINLLAPMYMSRAVLRDMLPRKSGHIVTVSSNAARRPGSPGNNAYSASKYGVSGFSDALRLEVGEFGIRVTVIEPGATETDIAETIADPGARQSMREHLHRDSAMQPGDVAAAIGFAITQHPRVNVDEIWLTPTRS